MYPPIFEICSVHPDVQTNIGNRLYAFGEAREGTAKPYAVWQTLTGIPTNSLSDIPDTDSWSIQVDVYALTPQQARDAAEALRNAIEPYAHITSWDGDGKDDDTNLYRFIFSVDWWASRSESSS